MSKRKIFDELMEGVAAMKSHRGGKITLRTYRVEAAPLPKVDSKLIRDTRKRLHCSRAVFARKLRINERTLEKWEQGRRQTQSAGRRPRTLGPQLSRHSGSSRKSRCVSKSRGVTFFPNAGHSFERSSILREIRYLLCIDKQ